MSLIELLERLTSVWYIHDSEDGNKRPIVESYDVKPVVEQCVNEDMNGEEIWNAVSDYVPEEIDDIVLLSDHSQESFDNAYNKLRDNYRKSGHLDASAFVNADNRELGHVEHFADFAKSIAIALGVNVTPELVSDNFWIESFNCCITPLEAAEELLRCVNAV